MRLIERLRWWAHECDRTNFGCQAKEMLLEAADEIERLQSEAEPVRHGRWYWLAYDANPKIGNWNCSLCHGIGVGSRKTPYCPNCGAMMDRCYCPSVDSYPQYGGAGITVCEEWHDIRNFKKWAEATGFVKGLTLDRIDGNKGYSPDNCRWATAKEQTNNRKNTLFLTHEGKTLPLTVWSEKVGINPHTLRDRVSRLKWDAEKALTTPVKHSREKRRSE